MSTSQVVPSGSSSHTGGLSSDRQTVGVHYRVGKKVGEGSFGVIFEGTNLLNSQQVRRCFPGGSAAGAKLLELKPARAEFGHREDAGDVWAAR